MTQGYATNGEGKVLDGNSTTSALNAAAVFTGAWINVSKYPDLSVAVKTDQDGTIAIQYSPDGTNIDSTITRYYRTAQIEPPHIFKNARPYARVVFTNTSASNQTYFRLVTMVGDRGELNIPIDATMSQDYDSVSVRPTEYVYEVALGRRQGATTWNKWGYNADIDTAAAETIWTVGGTLTRMTAADTFNVVSTSANDTSAGTGAQSIIIYGIDENYLAITEVVTLNGTTPVVTTNQWIGVNRAAIYLAGSGGENAGDINITVTTSGVAQAQIPTSAGSSQHAFFFVQAGHQALMDWLYINMVKISGGGGSPVVTTKAYVTSLVSGARYEVFRDYIDTAVENHTELRPSQPFVVGEKSLIEFRSSTDTNNTAVSVRFSLIEVRNVST